MAALFDSRGSANRHGRGNVRHQNRHQTHDGHRDGASGDRHCRATFGRCFIVVVQSQRYYGQRPERTVHQCPWRCGVCTSLGDGGEYRGL